MTLGIDLAAMAVVLLVALRIGPLFVLAPVFGAVSVPLRVRVFLALAFAALLAAVAGPSGGAVVLDPLALIGAAATEVLLGIGFAFGMFAAFGAFLFGGRVLDIQIGFGIATLIDPATRGQSPLLGTALNLMAVAVFFAVDGHHALVRALAWSLERLPPGTSIASLDPAAVGAQWGLMFSYGLLLVAPAVFALLLLDVAFAVMARTMPQMNVFIVALPLKVVVGVLVLALTVRELLPAMMKVFESVPRYWERLLA
jgi:flagellar biosynthesis protein FliR